MIKYVSDLTENWVAKRLPKRPKDANKGTFGKVLVIAGSEKYPGASYLSCAAAYRVGAGLVTLASIKSVCDFVIKKLPEVTLVPLPDETIYQKIYDFDVVLIGPGLGKDQTEFLRKLLTMYDMPKFVIDGDGLNALAKMDHWWKEIDEYMQFITLTPHPREMSRLTGLTVEEIQKNREKIAQEYATKWRQAVVLKGAKTVISSPAGEVKITSFANPLLSTAGTGDILSGIIAGLLAQGLDNFEAACCGVYIHGLAAEMLKEQLGDRGMLASDLLSVLPLSIRHIQTQNR